MAKKEIKKSKKGAAKPASTLAAHAEAALRDYEQALALLHRRDYTGAIPRFQEVLKTYPEEKEMADRCRLYLKVCQRELSEKVVPLKRAEDYYYQGIMESNRQRYDDALRHLDQARKLDPQDPRVLYAMASTHALSGNRDAALDTLKEAIDANPQNRIAAQQDPDFDGLRDDDVFVEMVSPAGS